MHHRDNQVTEQLKKVNRIVYDNAISAKEILSELNKALIDYEEMVKRHDAILSICRIVQTRLFTNEELISHFKSAIVKVTMDE